MLQEKDEDPSQGKVNCLQGKALHRESYFSFLTTHGEPKPLPQVQGASYQLVPHSEMWREQEYQTVENSLQQGTKDRQRVEQKAPKKWGNIGIKKNKLHKFSFFQRPPKVTVSNNKNKMLFLKNYKYIAKQSTWKILRIHLAEWFGPELTTEL